MPATLSQIEAWSTEHLIDAAAYWTQTADRWEDAFLTMRNQAQSITWHGAGGDALRQRTGADLSVVSGKADLLRQAAGIARNGASDIGGPSGESSTASKTRKMRDLLSEKTCRSPTPAAPVRPNGPRAKLRPRRSPLTYDRGPNNWKRPTPRPPASSPPPQAMSAMPPSRLPTTATAFSSSTSNRPVGRCATPPTTTTTNSSESMGRVGAGAALGGAAGLPEGGVGAIPGAIIGGAAGGIEAFIEGATESEPPKCGK
ncbi:transmembrane protein [Mycobacterium europaeum]|uniref:Transmembrane protein n=1 Tax=Mycobacterium europaeum TaxID=761804 RepID=A0A0U1DTY5_9MYCO|nr:transmembrane protein [Mycobacterium europaeum]